MAAAAMRVTIEELQRRVRDLEALNGALNAAASSSSNSTTTSSCSSCRRTSRSRRSAFSGAVYSFSALRHCSAPALSRESSVAAFTSA